MANDNAALVRTTARSTLWSYAATYGGKALILVTTVILARLLSKTEYGVVSIALTVIAFLEVMQDLGIGSALIYQRDESAADHAFWLGLMIAAGLFALTWLGAPLFAALVAKPETGAPPENVVPIIRALGLSFPLFALRNIHDALLRKNLAFKRRFVPDLTQVVGKGGISIGLALAGFGPWSLVWGQLGGSALGVVAYWLINPWRPRFHLSRQVARDLLVYGTSIVAINGLAVVLAQSDYLLVSRYLGLDELGVYTLAFRLPDLLVMQFCVVITGVMFPVYTRLRDDPQGLQKGFMATIRYVALITVPLSLGMALVTRPFVLALFTDKWIAAIPVMRPIAIYTLFLSLGFNVGDVYKAQGRPGILTRLSLVRIALLLPALYWATTTGTIVTVAWTHAAMAFVGSAINLFVATRSLKISFGTIIEALRPALVAGAVMALAVWAALAALDGAAPLIQLIAAIVVGAASYSAALWWTQRDVVRQAGQTLRGALARR